MVWPEDFSILWILLHNGFYISWIIGAAGILTAVLLHRKDKKCRFWPAIPALILWLVCEIAQVNVQSYGIEYLTFVFGCFAFCYGAAWLVADIFYLIKGNKQK